MSGIVITISIVLIAVGFLIRYNALWVYRILDRATRNSTRQLPEGYMKPR